MAIIGSGPIFPFSAYPVNETAFPHLYIGDGANSQHENTLGVTANLGTEAIWRLRFMMPPTLPTGTAKLRLLALADAVSGVVNFNPKWASVAVEEDPSSASLNAEGTSTITWAAGDDDVYKELKIDLDADTVVASEIIVMDLLFTTSLANEVSGWIPSVIWE